MAERGKSHVIAAIYPAQAISRKPGKTLQVNPPKAKVTRSNRVGCANFSIPLAVKGAGEAAVGITVRGCQTWSLVSIADPEGIDAPRTLKFFSSGTEQSPGRWQFITDNFSISAQIWMSSTPVSMLKLMVLTTTGTTAASEAFFGTEEYLATNHCVAVAGLNPLQHDFEFGSVDGPATGSDGISHRLNEACRPRPEPPSGQGSVRNRQRRR